MNENHRGLLERKIGFTSLGFHVLERLLSANIFVHVYPVDRESIHFWDWQAINESRILALRRQSPFRLFLPQISHSLFGHKHEVVLDQSAAHFDTEVFSLILVFDCLNIDDQRVFDTENRIRGLIWIILEI